MIITVEPQEIQFQMKNWNINRNFLHSGSSCCSYCMKIVCLFRFFDFEPFPLWSFLFLKPVRNSFLSSGSNFRTSPSSFFFRLPVFFIFNEWLKSQNESWKLRWWWVMMTNQKRKKMIHGESRPRIENDFGFRLNHHRTSLI